MPPSTPLVADLDPARAPSQAAPDALTRPLATMLRALDDEDLVEAAMPWLARRLSALMPSLLASLAHDTMTTGAGVGPGLEDETGRPSCARFDGASPPSAPVVPRPRESAAVSPGSPAADSPKRGSARAAEAAARRAEIGDFIVRSGPVSSTEIAAALGCSQSAIVLHVAELVRAGLVARGSNGAAWSIRYAATQEEADRGARAARRKTLAEARPNLAGQGAEDRQGADRRPLGASTVPLAAVDALPPTVDDDELDQVDDELVVPVERRRPLEQLLADEADAERDARAREAAVRIIRASSETNLALAARFGVTDTAVSYVRRGRTWRHVA